MEKSLVGSDKIEGKWHLKYVQSILCVKHINYDRLEKCEGLPMVINEVVVDLDVAHFKAVYGDPWK